MRLYSRLSIYPAGQIINSLFCDLNTFSHICSRCPCPYLLGLFICKLIPSLLCLGIPIIDPFQFLLYKGFRIFFTQAALQNLVDFIQFLIPPGVNRI
jgi:hypothetical protein